MTAPGRTFTTRRDGIRQALIDANIVGRSIFHPSALDHARTPYIVLVDNADSEPIAFGDGGPLRETVTGEARLYQANSRDADPYLAPRIARALQGLTFVVTRPGDPTKPSKVSVRVSSPTTEEAEGIDERVVRWTAYQDPVTP